MNILLVILIAVIILIGWLLLAPIQLILNSEERQFKLKVVSIGYASIIQQENEFSLNFRIAFYSRRLSLNEMLGKIDLRGNQKAESKKKPEKDLKKKQKKKKKPLSKDGRKWIIRLLRIPRSFRVREFFVNVDTGDYILNGYLFPVFGLLNYYRPKWSCNVNYYGRNQVSLFLQTSLLRIMYVFLK